MAHQQINLDLLQCEVCFEQYNLSNKIPQSLSCGHTFCSECLFKLSPITLCPLRCACTSQISINYAVKNIIENMNSAEGITEDNISSVQRDELARLTEQHRMYRARKERELAETREQHQDELIGTGILAAVGGALLAVGAFALSSIIKTSKKPSGDKR